MDKEINVGDHVKVIKPIATNKKYWAKTVFIVKRRLVKKGDLENGVSGGTMRFIVADPDKLDENGNPIPLDGIKFYKTDLVKLETKMNTATPFWQHSHIIGMHVWNNGKYIGQIQTITTRRNARGKGIKSVIIKKEDDTLKPYAMITLVNRKTKHISLTNTKNLTDVFDGSVKLKLNG